MSSRWHKGCNCTVQLVTYKGDQKTFGMTAGQVGSGTGNDFPTVSQWVGFSPDWRTEDKSLAVCPLQEACGILGQKRGGGLKMCPTRPELKTVRSEQVCKRQRIESDVTGEPSCLSCWAPASLHCLLKDRFQSIMRLF